LPPACHNLTRRTAIAGAIGTVGAVAAPFVVHAQNWPLSATIKFVVPYPPGGSTDVIARLVQPMLQQRLGATVIIDNRSGASGSVGTATVAKSPPDGNTWLIVFDNHAANPFVFGWRFRMSDTRHERSAALVFPLPQPLGRGRDDM
jgi:tripartite-type tricarboxylate transporter receptor subunit TctC